MNSKIYKMLCGGLACCGMIATFTACSDKFLKDKKNYGNFDSSNTYGSVDAATERLNTLYYWLLPTNGGDGNGTNRPNDWTSIGLADKWSKSTEEYGGFSMWVNPSEELTYDNVYVTITPDCEVLTMTANKRDMHKGTGRVIPGYIESISAELLEE